MMEVIKIMATSSKRAMHALLHSVPPALQRPPPTQASAGDSWILTAKSGSVSCGVTAPFSWVLVHTRFCLCPSSVCFPVLCKFWQPYGVVDGDLLLESLCHTYVCCTQSPCPVAIHCWPEPPQETLKHSSVSVSAGSLGSGVHKGLFEPSEHLWWE